MYHPDMWGEQASAVLKCSSFVGAMVGMCIMGYIGDVFGIDPAFIMTSLLMIIFAGLSGCISGGGDESMGTLLVARFFLGVGIGGCYPLASSKGSAESAGGSEGCRRDCHH